MKRILFSIIILLTAGLYAKAEPIDASRALTIARTTLLGNTTNTARRIAANAEMKVIMQDKLQAEPAWFVVAPTSGDGFVIVAGDDSEDAILGYSTEGTVDAESMPEALHELLDNYSTHIDLVRRGLTAPITTADEEEAAPVARKIPSSVPALISTEWSQSTPFNNLCPVSDDTNCLVGCVALSMAQIMSYYKYPECGTGTVSTRNNGAQVASIDLDNTPFDYANMLDVYNGDYTDEQANAVATLCLACGYAVDMQYTSTWSGAYQDTQRDALIKNFHYSHTARIIQRVGTSLTTDSKWKKRLKEELAAGRPIIVGGTHPSNGPHNFICDGYQTLKFHINWGWGPKTTNISYNGWYNILNLMLPDGTGTYETSDFTIGIQPAVDDEDTSKQYFIAANDSVANYEAEGYDLAFTLPSLTNATDTQAKGGVYYRITDADGNNKGDIKLATLMLRDKDSNSAQDVCVSMPSDLTDGTYYLTMAFLPTGSTSYQQIESMYCKTNIAVAIANGGITTVTALTDDEVQSAITSEIKDVTTVPIENINSNIYNLQGQRVNNPKHGLFIKNGKKIIK